VGLPTTAVTIERTSSHIHGLQQDLPSDWARVGKRDVICCVSVVLGSSAVFHHWGDLQKGFGGWGD
jgi:hypothetical protein